ncbi:MAG: glycosyltransferase family 9 protein, partial [Acidobacteriota bacterium]
DSRLLQLGLLPVVRPAAHEELRYFFLESRRYGEPGQGTISRITLGWLNGIFGGEDEIFPAVQLREEDRDLGLELCRKLRQGGAGFLAAASFGVGGNQSKRLPDPFEEQLLSRLLDDGCTVLLDKGVGEEERDRADRLVERVRAGGRAVIELNQRSARAELTAQELPCRMLTWQGEIGFFSALVAGCDEYIGYDSAGQHIAAALGVPTLDIFTGSASAVFRERWRPTGQGIVQVVAIPLSQKSPRDAGTILNEVAALHEKNKSGAIHTEK